MIVYICGPMRGKPHFNYPAFFEAEAMLNKHGFDTYNPARIDIEQTGFDGRTLPENSDWHHVPSSMELDTIIERDLMLVMRADAICLLDGWEQSVGANTEAALAKWRGMKRGSIQFFISQGSGHTPGKPLNPMPSERDIAEFMGESPVEGYDIGDMVTDALQEVVDKDDPIAKGAEWLNAHDEMEKMRRGMHPDTPEGGQVFPAGDAERLDYPIFEGLLDYFPHACAEVAKHSKIGNDQHNPGEPMHWAKEKSIGRGNKIVRHLVDGWRMAMCGSDRETVIRHFAAMTWRANELLERYITGMPPFGDNDV